MSALTKKGGGSLFSLGERVALTFEETVRYLELSGEGKFRIAAYQKAAHALRNLEEDLWDVVEQGRLTDIAGIGKSMASNINCYIETQTIPLLEELKQQYPADLLQLTTIAGLGVKKILQLYRELDIKGLEDLKSALESELVSKLKGFTLKGEAKLLVDVEKALSRKPSFLKDEREEWAHSLSGQLRDLPFLHGMHAVGALRQRLPEAPAIELMLVSSDEQSTVSSLLERLKRERIEATTENRRLEGGIDLILVCFHHPSGCPVLIWICPRRFAAWGLLTLSGPLEFVRYLKDKLASEELEEEDEETLLARARLTHMLPEVRHRQELWQAVRLDLLSVVNIQGNLHTHSTDSDGKQSFVEMAAEARRRGHSYLGISDHSRSLHVANGLSIERLEQQIKDIRAIDSKSGAFSLFAASECDILEDGSLDYPAEVLDRLDYAIIAVHSFFHLSYESMTARILKALSSHAKVKILAHPTGRLIGKREGYQADWDKIFTACAAQEVAVEINAHPWRLDLSEELLDLALDKGCLISINTDAHSLEGFDMLPHGVDMARRAAVAPRRVINTWSPERLRAWFS